MQIPDAQGRGRILRVLTRNLRIDGSLDFDLIAGQTSGYDERQRGESKSERERERERDRKRKRER